MSLDPKKLKNPLQDVVYLLDRGYSKNERLFRFIAGHYLLNRSETRILYRATHSTTFTKNIEKKRVFTLKGMSVGIDGYNILITVEAILMGEAGAHLFIGTDGFLRDFAESYGKYKQSQLTEKALYDILLSIKELGSSAIDFYLDSMVSRSGDLASLVRKRMKIANLQGNVYVVKSPDNEVIKKDVILSHDSEVLRKATNIFDLPLWLIKRRNLYNLILFDARKFLRKISPSVE